VKTPLTFLINNKTTGGFRNNQNFMYKEYSTGSLVKDEFIQILKMEIQKCDDLALKNHLINEIRRIEHLALNRVCVSMGIETPPMNKLEVKEIGVFGLQTLINVNKKLQFILLKHFKYNNNISDETRKFLDIKIASLYKKIGKAIRKMKINQEKYLKKKLVNNE
jgi:hypothetical protein